MGASRTTSNDRTRAGRDTSRSDEGEGAPSRPPGRTWLLRGLGPVLAILVYLALGAAELSGDARWVAATVTLMAVWWMTEAIPLSATALLPIVLFPVLTELTVEDATLPYADPIVFLFLGGFLIAIAMQKWNLHRRIALRTLRGVGTHPRRIILGVMISTAFLSMWVSNTATALMMLPIAMSVLTLVVERTASGKTGGAGRAADAGGSDAAQMQAELESGAAVTDVVEDSDVQLFGVALLLSVAWSASIGGLGTLLGSPPNAIVAGYISSELDESITFLQWLMIGLPMVLIFIPVAWLLITRVLYRFQLDDVPGGRDMVDEQLTELGPMSQGEKMVLAVFAGAAFLWIVPGLLSNIGAVAEALPFLGLFDDTAIAIGAGLILFLLPGDDQGRNVLTWDDAEDGLPWGVLLLFGGGLSLAAAVADTGLDEWFGQQVGALEALPVILLVAVVAGIVLLLTEVTSNTATAATFIPVLGGVALGIGADPVALLIPAALAATCAFMLPVATPPNAIVFGSGAVTIRDMVRGGIVLNVVGIVLITLLTALVGPWALGLTL